MAGSFPPSDRTAAALTRGGAVGMGLARAALVVCLFALYAFLAPTRYQARAVVRLEQTSPASVANPLRLAQALKVAARDARTPNALDVTSADGRTFHVNLRDSDEERAVVSCNLAAERVVTKAGEVLALYRPSDVVAHEARVTDALVAVLANQPGPTESLRPHLEAYLSAKAAVDARDGSRSKLARLIEPARSAARLEPNRPLILGFGGLSALVVGFAPVLLSLANTRPARSADETPVEPAEQLRRETSVIAYRVPSGWQAPADLDLEPWRALSSELSTRTPTSCLVVGMTSLAPTRQRKARAAAELAVTVPLKRSLRVLLIEADFHAPALHLVLGVTIPPFAGFLDSVQARVNGAKEQHWHPVRCTDWLHVLGQGATATPELILSHYFEQCVRDLRACYDLIIMSGPTLSESGELRAFADVVDRMVIVCTAEEAAEADEAMKTLGGLTKGEASRVVVRS